MDDAAGTEATEAPQNRSARITLTWADGKHEFRLAIGELRELQEKTNQGIRSIARRISSGDEFVDEVREVIRIGLIGGGMAPPKALKLVERYVDGRPLIENISTAQAIAFAAIVGAPEESVGKKAEAAEEEMTISQTTNSASPPSTPPASPSAAP